MSDRNRKSPKSSSERRGGPEGVDKNYSLDFTSSWFGVTICLKRWTTANNTPQISQKLKSSGEINYHVDRLIEELERIRPLAIEALKQRVPLTDSPFGSALSRAAPWPLTGRWQRCRAVSEFDRSR